MFYAILLADFHVPHLILSTYCLSGPVDLPSSNPTSLPTALATSSTDTSAIGKTFNACRRVKLHIPVL